MIEFVNNYFIPGLVLGGIYALGAIGVSLLYAILRFAHFAHGDLMTFGAYVAFAAVTLVGLPVLAALPAAILGAAAAAIAIDRLAYRPFRTSRPIVVVIASFGVALMIRSLVMLVWGVQPEPYASGIAPPIDALAPLRVQHKHAVILAVTVVLIAAVHALLTRTKIGKAMRAMSDDADLARATGIDTERVILWTWIVGAALAASAGVLTGLDTHVAPDMGWNLVLPIFAAAILGGLGRPYGAILGGLAIGLIEELSSYPLFGDGPLIRPGYKTGLAFAIMVLMLIWRPQGLLKGRIL